MKEGFAKSEDGLEIHFLDNEGANTNRVLKALFKGGSEIVLVPRHDGGTEDYWAVGKLNVGRLMSIAAKLTGEYAESEVVAEELPFELRVSTGGAE